MKKKPAKRVDWFQFVPIVIVLLVAAFLRLYKIREYMTFLGDEGRDVLVVKHFIVDGDIPFIGPTASVAAFFLGPLYYYLMAPFLFLFRLDPVGPAVMVALFSVATVFLIYIVGSTWYGKWAGVIASSLYAVSPLVIAQSRSSWNPNVVPFFALLYIYAVYKSIQTKNLWWFFVAGACIGAGIQLHYLFLFLLPVGFMYFLLYGRRKEFLLKYLIYVIGAIVVLLPFIGFEVKNGLPNTKTIIAFLTAGKEVAYSNHPIVTVSDIMFRLFGRLVFYMPHPDHYYRYSPVILNIWEIGVIGGIVISLGVLGYQIYVKKRRHDILLVLWFLFGIFLFMLYQKAIYDYYLVILFPLPFLLVGSALTGFWKNIPLKVASFTIVLFLVALNLSGNPFQYPPNKQLDQAEKTARFVYDQAQGKPFNFALITASNSDHAYRYFLEIWGNPPVTIENVEKDPYRTSVTDQLLIICEVANCKPLGDSLWEVAGFGRAEVVGRWNVGVLEVYKLVHFKS